MNTMYRPHRLVSLAACLALLGGRAPLSAQEPAAPTGPPPPTLELATVQQSKFDFVGALDTYEALLRQAIDELQEARYPSDPAAEPDTIREAELLAEIEWLLMHFLDVADSVGNRVDAAHRLASLKLDPTSDGLAWARAQNRSQERSQRLSVLEQWQFIGPFNNERGAAFQQQLPPEIDPDPNTIHQGAEREVAWRSLPRPVPQNGILDFGRLLRPAQQSALLVRCWVQSPRDQEAQLLLGIDGEVRVWHDGTPVFQADGRHRLALDSLVAPIKLHAGWNELTLKLGSRDHYPRLHARLVDADSQAPMALPSQDSPPGTMLAANLRGEAAPKINFLSVGARAYYQATTLVAPEAADAWMRLGQLQRNYQVVPEAQHPGRKALQKAVELAPNMPGPALALEDELFPGLRANPAEIDLNPWLQQAAIAEELFGTHAQVLNHRTLAAARFQEIAPRARDYAEQLVRHCGGAPMALYVRAMITDNMGQDGLADSYRLQMLQHPDIAYYPALEEAASAALPEASPDRIKHLERAYARTDDAGTLRQLLYLRELQREFTQQADFEDELKQRLALDPWNAALYREYAAKFQSRGNLERALGLVERAIEIKPDAPRNYALLARLHLQGGNTEEAVAALELELERDFGNSDEQRLLDYLRQQDNATFSQPYQEELASIIERHPPQPVEEGVSGSPYEYLTVTNVVRVHPDATADRYFRQVIRVLEPSAARRLDRRYLPYAWGDQDLRLLTARVRHEDGTESTARTDRGPRARIVDLPELRVGDVIDLEWRIDDLRPGLFGQYFGMDQALSPEADVPVRESQVVILEPAELPLKFHSMKLAGAEAVTEDAGEFGTSHRWLVRDIAPILPEPLMPPLQETAPRVQASSYASWDEFGQWWWQLIEAGITVSPEMSAEVATLTEGLETRQEQVDAIYNFVANDIRYNAWEFGIHGYQPYTAPVIFSRRFGDCKDKAILLKAMLSEIGVESWPVLIRRVADGTHRGLRFQEDLTLALVSDFNHCIAYIPEQEGVEECFVDGTARLHPRNALPYDDRGAEVLIVREDGIERTRIPDSPAADNERTLLAALQLHADGSADAEITMHGTGRFDPDLRRAFSGGEKEHIEIAENIMGSLFGPVAEGVTIEVSDIEDMAEPVKIVIRGHAERFASVVPEGLEMPTTLSERGMLTANGLAGLEERQSDLLQPIANQERLQWYIELPPGFQLAAPAPVIEHTETGLAHYRWELRDTEQGFAIAEEIDFYTTRVPAQDYPRLRAFGRIVDRSQGATLTLLAPPPPPDDLQPVNSSSTPDAGKPAAGGNTEDQQ